MSSDDKTKHDAGWVDRTKWEPTPEQFEAYFKREVVMAREKLLNNVSTGAMVRAMDTLHSTAAMTQAQAELEREGLRAK